MEELNGGPSFLAWLAPQGKDQVKVKSQVKAALALFPAGHGLPTLEEVRAKLDLEEVENARRGLNLIKKYHTESTEALIKEVGAWVRARFQSDDGGKKFRSFARRVLYGYESRRARRTREEVEAPVPEGEQWTRHERWARSILVDFWKAQDAAQGVGSSEGCSGSAGMAASRTSRKRKGSSSPQPMDTDTHPSSPPCSTGPTRKQEPRVVPARPVSSNDHSPAACSDHGAQTQWPRPEPAEASTPGVVFGTPASSSRAQTAQLPQRHPHAFSSPDQPDPQWAGTRMDGASGPGFNMPVPSEQGWSRPGPPTWPEQPLVLRMPCGAEAHGAASALLPASLESAPCPPPVSHLLSFSSFLPFRWSKEDENNTYHHVDSVEAVIGVSVRAAVPPGSWPMPAQPASGSLFNVACFLRPLTDDLPVAERGRKHPRVLMTGVCGKVAEESAVVAVTWMEQNYERFRWTSGPKRMADLSKEVCVEVTEMNNEKDGDSLGVAITVALVHYLLGRWPMRDDYVITGAMTLSGRLGAVGAVQMKAILTWRSGYKGLIIPKANEDVLTQPWRAATGNPLEIVPTAQLQAEWRQARAALDIQPMATIEDVLNFMLQRLRPPLGPKYKCEVVTVTSFNMIVDGSCAMMRVESCMGPTAEGGPPRKPIVTGGAEVPVREMVSKVWNYLLVELAAGTEGALKPYCQSRGIREPPAFGPFRPSNRWQVYLNLVGAPSSAPTCAQAVPVLAILWSYMCGRTLRSDVAFIGACLYSGQLLPLGVLRICAFHALMDEGVTVLYLPQDDVVSGLKRMLAKAEAERTDGRRLTLKPCAHLADILRDREIFI